MEELVVEPPNLMSHRSARLPLDTKHSRENTKLLGSVGHTSGENLKIHIFAIRITNERIKLTTINHFLHHFICTSEYNIYYYNNGMKSYYQSYEQFNLAAEYKHVIRITAEISI